MPPTGQSMLIIPKTVAWLSGFEYLAIIHPLLAHSLHQEANWDHQCCCSETGEGDDKAYFHLGGAMAIEEKRKKGQNKLYRDDPYQTCREQQPKIPVEI